MESKEYCKTLATSLKQFSIDADWARDLSHTECVEICARGLFQAPSWNHLSGEPERYRLNNDDYLSSLVLVRDFGTVLYERWLKDNEVRPLPEEMKYSGSRFRFASLIFAHLLGYNTWDDFVATFFQGAAEQVSYLPAHVQNQAKAMFARSELTRGDRTEEGFAWDRWEKKALKAGLSEDLASLGRAVYREAIQHSWDDGLFTECGCADDGHLLLKWALNDPKDFEERIDRLMVTDGLSSFDDE